MVIEYLRKGEKYGGEGSDYFSAALCCKTSFELSQKQ